jgi:hypothetical protein
VKIQDLLFLLVTGGILASHKITFMPHMAIILLIGSAVFYSFSIFFTAERFVIYALVYMGMFSLNWMVRNRGKMIL